ncbi:MAG: exodeoxyribonuclease V subunit gamma, partial [Candidatus Omnitrophica bacterium]|nr:exodeoxyribonuclease V subunit gamma [Candidatus Omnitrophota bacterium]
MALHLVYSNDIHRLADRLCETLANERREKVDPFAPQTLLVPNPHLAKWLQVRFCQGTGLSMNIKFPFLEKGLWELAIETWAGQESWTYRHLEREKVQLLVLAELLDRERLERLPLFRDYLSRQPGLTETGQVGRAWQLSERLARLFSDYEYNRGNWIDAWLAAPGRKIEDPVEANERDLYLALFGPEGSAKNLGGGAHLTLPQLVRELDGTTSSDSDTLTPVHLFGFSQLSPFHLDLVFRLAKHRNLFLDQFNHSPNLWAEVGTERDDPDPVKFWGRPGEEFVQLIDEFHSDRHSDVEFHCERLESPKEKSPTFLA